MSPAVFLYNERTRHTGDYAPPENANGALLAQHAVVEESGARYSSHQPAM
jgi:hypothetical protein